MKSKLSKHKTIIHSLFILLLLVPLLVTVSCDKRAGEKPTLVISVNDPSLYGDGKQCNLDHTTVRFNLSGSSSYISQARINVNIDESKGFFVGAGGIGTGGADHVTTDKQGVATGIYNAREGAFGITTLTATHNRFRDVKETAVFYLYDIPEVELTADNYTISKDGSANLTVRLSDEADNIANVPIHFSANSGIIAPDKVNTDAQGVARTVFDANEQTGNVTIRAELGFCSNAFATITISREE